MILPPNADDLSDAALKRALIKLGYDSDAAQYIIDVERYGVDPGGVLD